MANSKRQLTIILAGLSFLLAGCVVRTYQVAKDRIDQDLTAGNRGYLKGSAPAGQEKERKTTRTTQVVEIELRSPIKFEKMPKPKPVEKMPLEQPIVEEAKDQRLWGNRGLISERAIPEITETGGMEKYTVQKNDTLQKISKKFYGTSKKWTKIYEANKDVLKGPDKVYPGQILNIPIAPKTKELKEPKTNLK